MIQTGSGNSNHDRGTRLRVVRIDHRTSDALRKLWPVIEEQGAATQEISRNGEICWLRKSSASIREYAPRSYKHRLPSLLSRRKTTLSNIVRLQARAAQHALPLQTGDLTTDNLCSQLVNRATELRGRARSELERVIALLGVAVSNTRRITDQISNPGVRKSIESELVSIETTLKVAHEKALDL